MHMLAPAGGAVRPTSSLFLLFSTTSSLELLINYKTSVFWSLSHDLPTQISCYACQLGSRKIFCENPEVDALYRASNGEYLAGSADSVSIALVDGSSPSDFRNRVRTELTYVEGQKKQPNAVIRRMIDQAEAWKIVEAHGSSSGSSGGAARSGARHEKKQSAKGLTCHKCGEVGHIQRNCHKGRSQGSAHSTYSD